MLHGFTTLNFYVDDVRAAARWYADLLGIEPYFVRPTAEEPAYVEFRIGAQQVELGLIDSRYRPGGLRSEQPAGAVMNWHVDDVQTTYDHTLAQGATSLQAPRALGAPGWVIATVVDPFGNLLGLMHSPHYEEMTGAARAEQ